MPRQNRTDTLILGLLATRPLAGYDVKRMVEERLAHFWSESLGNIYPRLDYLREEGLVSRIVERQAKQPDLHVYDITPAGRAVLEAWFYRSINRRPPRDELLLKLFLGRHAPPGALIEQLQQYRMDRILALGQLEEIQMTIGRLADRFSELIYWSLTLSARIRSTSAQVEWADEAIGRLQSLQTPSIQRRA